MKSKDSSFSFLLKLREAWKEKQSSSQKILLSYKPFSVNWNTLGPSVLGRPLVALILYSKTKRGRGGVCTNWKKEIIIIFHDLDPMAHLMMARMV